MGNIAFYTLKLKKLNGKNNFFKIFYSFNAASD